MQRHEPVTSAATRRIEPRPRQAFARRSRLSVVTFVLALLPVVSWASCASGLMETGPLKTEREGLIAWAICVVLSLIGAYLGFLNALQLSRIRKSRHAELDRPLGLGLSLLAGIVGLLSPVATFVAGWYSYGLPLKL